MPPKKCQPADVALREFLQSRRTASAPEHTACEYGPQAGKYKILDSEHEKFLKLVHDTIFGEKPVALSLLEKHLPHGGPVCIDLDFRYTAGSHLDRHFDEEMIKNFVVHYAAALYRYFDLAVLDGKPLRFFVMLKPGPEQKKEKSEVVHSDGIHVICPDLTLDPQTQFTLRGYMLDRNIIHNVFDNAAGFKPASDVFDVSVIHRNNWFIYGATKPDKSWYKVEHIFHIPSDMDVAGMTEEGKIKELADNVEEEDSEEYDSWDFTKILSIRLNHGNLTPIKPLEDRQIEWEALKGKWGGGKALPAGIRAPASPPMVGHAGGEAGESEPPTIEHEFMGGEAAKPSYTSEDVEQVYELLDKCINATRRAKDYGAWVDLGICLYNISSDDKMMKKWASVSRRADGYNGTDDDVYDKKWQSFQSLAGSRKLRMGSLHFWAAEDNPSKYKEITERSHIGWILNNPEGTHVKVANLVKRMYQYEFCCTYVRPRMMEYFQYVGNYWKQLKSNNELRSRLTNHVARVYLASNAEAGRLAAAGGTNFDQASEQQLKEEQEKKNKMLEKSKVIIKTCTMLEGAPFKDNVMKECNEKFYDESFTELTNKRKDIFACGNCVVELRHYDGDATIGATPRVFVRKGRPDDYASFVMGRENELEPIMLDYDVRSGALATFDPNTPEQRELDDFFTKIFPDENLKHYVLTLLAACLEGENREQKFYIMTGGGGNGKSVLINFMRFVFGDYQTSLNTAALTRKRPESGAANPDIITLKSKRFIYMQEPDEGERLNTARIKQFTGGDVVEARGLFSDQEKFKLMGRIFFSTNDLPPVSSMDGGTWRRMMVIPFVSSFKDRGDPAIDPANNIYEKDVNLEDKFKQNGMRAAFLRLLLHYWETRYLTNGLARAPETVLEAINRYKQDNDSFIAFATDNLIREQGSIATISEVCSRYKYWLSTQPGRKSLKKQEIIDRLTKLFKSSDGGRTYNDVRVALDGEDISGNYVGGGFS